MSLNPIHYTENVITGFLKYQLTAYALADEHLHAQMRRLLSLEETRRSPLLQGPYISLSRSFAAGAAVQDLVAEGLFHPHMEHLIPYPHLYNHQEEAIRSIASGKTTLVSTGTGSGKTEAFLYPIISRCLHLRDTGAPAGIVAVIVYPMNALAEDQLGRLRVLLAGSGISFGMYVGSTPERDADVGATLAAGASQADYEARVREASHRYTVHPAEERCSREAMRRPGGQPRILLTNVKQLELLLTRYTDVELFDNALLEYLVFDEAHTYTGARGAETACLIRRLRSFCGRGASDTVCVATSATIADASGTGGAAQAFASRFFGVDSDRVTVVNERYQADEWRTDRSMPPPFPDDPATVLQQALAAIEPPVENALPVSDLCRRIMGVGIDSARHRWQDSLYEALAGNELVYRLSQYLRTPKPLQEVHNDLVQLTGRAVSDEELLVWLSLGAAAVREGRPLLRPVVHGFVRGIPGAVITFPTREDDLPHLYLSTQEELEEREENDLFPLKLFTCTTCGQHYYEHHVKDFEFAKSRPGGGAAHDGHVCWETLSPTTGGKRVVLVDRLIGDEDDDAHNHVVLHFCRHCGALHDVPVTVCDACGRSVKSVALMVMRQNEDRPGKLRSCVTCGAIGGATGIRYREPIRPVRATAVADVHVLAQEMIRKAERKRLLVFADNRQDAAFQAGWMRDHARRFRLRSLMWEFLRRGPRKIGDLVGDVESVLDRDDDLSRALIPEVWDAYRKNAAPAKHAEERRYYLRIQVLREFTTGLRQRFGLEPWGKVRVDYDGIHATDQFIVEHAGRLDVSPEDLLNGVSTLVDQARRRQLLFDPEGKIFSKAWMDGDREIQRGYLSSMRGVPKGLKLRRDEEDDTQRIQQWLSSRGGDTPAAQAVRGWGIDADDVDQFLSDLWRYLVAAQVLTHVTLTGSRGRALPNCLGAHQVHSDALLLVPQDEVWQCGTCRRRYARPTPRLRCPSWRCDGSLNVSPSDVDDYDLLLLDDDGEMVRAAEHSAQVPHEDRERIEREFKSGERGVNTLVCTPTLEMGVDIGGLDSVLMRNVPPLPANYWQRAGRAGRRHRVAVNLTYARPVTHDQFFYGDPLRMLEGAIEPPRFNLRNDLMVRKHVHAATITRLHQLARRSRATAEGEEIAQVLKHVFPRTVKDYLFSAEGAVLDSPRDVSSLSTIIGRYEADIVNYLLDIFRQGWPDGDQHLVTEAVLTEVVRGTAHDLAQVLASLKRRLDWALGQLARLDSVRLRQGTRSPEEDAHFHRCDRLVKRLKGIDTRQRREAEGYDDTLTFSVLAVEGFLPGYGLETGSIIGTANMPRHTAITDFDLPRPPALALREYVPGNMIYANGHKFVARYFHLDAGNDSGRPSPFIVDAATESVVPASGDASTTAPMAGADLEAVPISDVDLTHSAHISDDEDYRFQLNVAVYGREMERHGGGTALSWGDKTVLSRRSVHYRLVNVGTDLLVKLGRFGYPVCLVCGQSVSPMASDRQLDDFKEHHRNQCGRDVRNVGFYCDTYADALTINDCQDRKEAYSVLEAIRVGATRVLDMERDDLMILVTGDPSTAYVDATLIDPMPGGSGLITQICERWEEIVVAALDVAGNCRWNCSDACDGCLSTFRNSYYHRHLDRHVAVSKIELWGTSLVFSHEVPPRLPAVDQGRDGMPVNEAETILKSMLQRAGFPDGLWHHQIVLGRPLGSTSPDIYYEDDQVCVYLDGLSAHIHGNSQTAERDREIRDTLRNEGYDVLTIAAADLYDRVKMSQHLFRLARLLLGRDQAVEIRERTTWFSGE